MFFFAWKPHEAQNLRGPERQYNRSGRGRKASGYHLSHRPRKVAHKVTHAKVGQRRLTKNESGGLFRQAKTPRRGTSARDAALVLSRAAQTLQGVQSMVAQRTPSPCRSKKQRITRNHLPAVTGEAVKVQTATRGSPTQKAGLPWANRMVQHLRSTRGTALTIGGARKATRAARHFPQMARQRAARLVGTYNLCRPRCSRNLLWLCQDATS